MSSNYYNALIFIEEDSNISIEALSASLSRRLNYHQVILETNKITIKQFDFFLDIVFNSEPEKIENIKQTAILPNDYLKKDSLYDNRIITLTGNQKNDWYLDNLNTFLIVVEEIGIFSGVILIFDPRCGEIICNSPPSQYSSLFCS